MEHSLPDWNATRPSSSFQVVAALGMVPSSNIETILSTPALDCSLVTVGLPSSPRMLPPAESTASAKFTVRPSYFWYWPAKQSAPLAPVTFSLIVAQAVFISSHVLGGSAMPASVSQSVR